MPYQSKAQQRFMHAQHPDIAARWDKKTKKTKGGFKGLPARVHKDGHWTDKLVAHHTGKIAEHQAKLDRLHSFRARPKVKAAQQYKKINKKLPGETKPETFTRHQRQIAGGITAGAAIPALLALKSGRAASSAMAAGDQAAHAVHSGMQLRHAATATALGGLAGGVGAMPVPKRILSINPKRNAKPKVPKTGITHHSFGRGSAPASNYDKSGVGKGVDMSVDAWGVVRTDLPVEKAFTQPQQNKTKPTFGRMASAGVFAPVHGLVAGAKGHKLQAGGSELAGGLAGGVAAGALTRGRGAPIGEIAGSAAGGAYAHKKGFLKPQSAAPTPAAPKPKKPQLAGLSKAYTPGSITYHSEQAAMHGRKKASGNRQISGGLSGATFGGAAGLALHRAAPDIARKVTPPASSIGTASRALKMANTTHKLGRAGLTGSAAAVGTGLGVAGVGAARRSFHAGAQNRQMGLAQSARRSRNAGVVKSESFVRPVANPLPTYEAPRSVDGHSEGGFRDPGMSDFPDHAESQSAIFRAVAARYA